MPAIIKVGISAWTDATLLASGWYPPGAKTPEARLRHYASIFTLTENDSVYYALPDPQRSAAWAHRTPPGFTMDVKAFAPLTGHYTDARRLPRDLRDALPPPVRDKRRVYPRDVGPDCMDALWLRFRALLEPLRQAGTLGAVLFQLPPWLPGSREGRRVLVDIRERMEGHVVAVEFRNHHWVHEPKREATLRFLEENDLLYVSVDEPQGSPWSVPPIAEATGRLAYVRFHGRNRATWQASCASASERFNYAYTQDELQDWVPRIRALASRADEVHVVMNNCYRDASVRNAEEMRDLLGADGLSVSRPEKAEQPVDARTKAPVRPRPSR